MTDLNALYSYQGQEPQRLPERISLSDGRSRTDASTFTEEELNDAGFTGPHENPSINIEYQTKSWNLEKVRYDVKDKSDEELWQVAKEKRNLLLKESDWACLVDSPENLFYNEWFMYRQRLRDLPDKFPNPKEIIWPQSPEGRSDNDFDQKRGPQERMSTKIPAMENMIDILFNRIAVLEEKLENLTT